MSVRAKAISVCLIVGSLLLLAACGSSNSSSSSSAAPAGAPASSSSSASGGGGGNTNPPAPTVISISPTTIAAGSADVTLTVNGTGFLSSTVIRVGGKPEATTFVSAAQVTAKVPAAQLVSGGDLAVIAVNGSQTSGSGAVINFEVSNPTPAISSGTMSTTARARSVPLAVGSTRATSGGSGPIHSTRAPQSRPGVPRKATRAGCPGRIRSSPFSRKLATISQ